MYVENWKIHRRLYDWGYAILAYSKVFEFSAAILEKGLFIT